MSRTIVASFDALEEWRTAAAAKLADLETLLADNDLCDAGSAARLALLRRRISGERHMLAVVGEFSRGKSELINALLMPPGGRRILPVSPGRTTMCPVEIGYRRGTRPSVALLAMQTRREGATLAELREDPAAWTRTELGVGDFAGLAAAMAQVAETIRVDIAEARELDLCDDSDAAGEVEIPRWRHAIVNHPHPLLRRGLALVDTPGLNALGAEPELTLGLLGEAEALLFVLGADTGVTRSDFELWRDHLAHRAVARFVVLNKCDALRDPMHDEEQVRSQIERQRRAVAQALEVDAAEVFAVSAREALVARREGDAAMLERSGLPALEAAIAARLLDARRDALTGELDAALVALVGAASHRVAERRRQVAEQTLELRGLRGKSQARLCAARGRIADEAGDLERLRTQIRALRAVHKRLLWRALNAVSGPRLRREVERFGQELRPALLRLEARRAFEALAARLRAALAEAIARGDETREMMSAAGARLNAEFALALAMPPRADMSRFGDELAQIEADYLRYLRLAGALRLLRPHAIEKFERILLARLRVVFERAGAEVELWSRSALAQADAAFNERRETFARREAAIERIESAAGALEGRLDELARADAALLRLQGELGVRLVASRDAARADPARPRAVAAR